MSSKESKSPAKKNIHSGHRERMRKKFFKNGIDCFEDYEVLEILMYYVHKRKNTNEIGHLLIDEFGTLENVFNAKYADLLKIDGIGESGAMLINFIGKLRNKITNDSIKDSEIKFKSTADLASHCRDFFVNLTEERLIMLSLNNGGRVISRDIISEGTTNATAVNSRKILETALNKNAASIILAHNHPGASAHPSENDIIFTNTIIDSLRGMNIDLLDHIICGEVTFFSMRDRGLLKNPYDM